ncbi:MAG: phosphotransferase [Eubacterium sp.]|nr:phosphotransferase [Eubacterium sp.]
MKYINAKDCLPEELLEEIMEYVEGTYIYIPKKEENKKQWGNETAFRREMELRNQKIYEHFLIGMPYGEIAEMYHLSEKSIRRIVLEERKKSEMEKIRVNEILRNYGIEGETKQIYTSAWDIDGEYVLKKYEDKNELINNIKMLKALGKEQVPVPQIRKTVDEKDYVEGKNQYWLLTTKLKGSNIVNMSRCNDEWFVQMGKILGELHQAFGRCENEIEYWNNSLLGEMESWVRDNLKKKKLDYLEQKDVDEAIEELRKNDGELPRNLIHRDVHLGNFLFCQGEFSGYIDFDLCQKNIRIFDLCYFLLGLLLEDEENYISEDRWFEVLQYVVKGYNSVMKLSEAEKESIPVVMKNIELLFVAYFIGEEDEVAARESAKLFYFVKENQEKIKKNLTFA